jgi:hypothetical protein
MDRRRFLKADRDGMRLHLQATRTGPALPPHRRARHDSGALEPFVRERHAALAVPAPARIRVLGRAGGAAQAVPPPRREPAAAHRADG